MSREEKLFEAITDIDDKYIEEADENMVTVHPGRKRWIAVAACFCLLIVALIPLLGNLAPKDSVKSSDFTDEAKNTYGGIENAMDTYSESPEEVGEPKLTAIAVEYDFDSDMAWVKVVWNNPTDKDLKVSPKFIVARIGDYDTIESTIVGDTKVSFESVLYTVPAGGEYTFTYEIDRGIYDISKPGHYRIYFDTEEIPENLETEKCFDIQLD